MLNVSLFIKDKAIGTDVGFGTPITRVAEHVEDVGMQVISIKISLKGVSLILEMHEK